LSNFDPIKVYKLLFIITLVLLNFFSFTIYYFDNYSFSIHITSKLITFKDYCIYTQIDNIRKAFNYSIIK